MTAMGAFLEAFGGFEPGFEIFDGQEGLLEGGEEYIHFSFFSFSSSIASTSSSESVSISALAGVVSTGSGGAGACGGWFKDQYFAEQVIGDGFDGGIIEDQGGGQLALELQAVVRRPRSSTAMSESTPRSIRRALRSGGPWGSMTAGITTPPGSEMPLMKFSGHWEECFLLLCASCL